MDVNCQRGVTLATLLRVRIAGVIFLVAMAAARAAGPEAATTQGVVELLGQARAHETIDLARAWQFAEQARAAARTPADRAQAALCCGSILRRRGDYDAALATARAGLPLAESLRDDQLVAEFVYLIGQTEWSATDFPSALQHYKRAAALAEQCGDLALAARSHSGVGRTYFDLEDKAHALRHYEVSVALAEKCGSERVLADALNNFGNFHTSHGELATGVDLHRRALALRQRLNNRAGLADSYFNLGTAMARGGQPEEALESYARALEIYQALGYTRNLANLHHSFAGIYRQLNRTDEGLEHLKTASKLAEELDTPLLWANIHREYAATMAARGDYRAALDHQQKLMTADEEVRGERTRRQVAALNVRYETERRQHEIAMLRRDQELKEAELRRARTERYGFPTLLLATGIAVAAVVSRQRLKLASERRVHEETRVAKEAAERADAFKTRLVGIASHDLKAPVTAMIGAAELLAREPDDRACVAEMADAIAGEGRRTLRLIRDLLDLAALETGRIVLERMPVELATIARESVAAFESKAQAKAQRLTCTFAQAERTMVSVDPARIRQALDNLVDNALKFTPSGGTVEVIVSAERDEARIAVRDSGPGLMPADYASIFQPFQKLSARPTGGESSSGLGLSIAREIVSLHGGQMVVESTPGDGATFGFVLPLAVT